MTASITELTPEKIIKYLRKTGKLDEEKLKKFKEWKAKRKNRLVIIASVLLMLATYRFITQDEMTTKLHGIDRAGLVYLTLVPLALLGLLRTYSPRLLKMYNTHEFTNATIQKKRKTTMPGSGAAAWDIEYSYKVNGRLYEFNNAFPLRNSITNCIFNGLDTDPIFLEDNKMTILYDPAHPYYTPHTCTKKEMVYNLRNHTPNYSINISPEEKA